MTCYISWIHVLGLDVPSFFFFLVNGGWVFTGNKAAWEMYEADNLPRLVDPMLDGNFSETEAVGFVKVALLCVQEKCRLRPNMSKAIKMMRGEIDIHSTQITRPGFIVDIMDVKIGRKNHKAQYEASQTGASQTGAAQGCTLCDLCKDHGLCFVPEKKIARWLWG
ncbi:CYSTEINE-RICH RECEPTOR-LIKE PROTEIN KINASE 3 [Salix koriyanagi]|uniref:CYSTEINE-RICH RECEPTOR-LIKE PROTEIN KINASE 3 n=1 Tax=Salix koriyanagi TaxID=2511006 RepID=A0A9Q0WT02_9ROSI|nr:CYSTEINE-RICH RECEPTOR-LIKE PROTEIN KINASE 3 [Salix koriyanagi]